MNKLDRIINYYRNIREESVPTMNTSTPNGSAGFSSDADSSGPNAGTTFPLGKFDGRSKIMKRLSPHFRELFNKTKKRKK